MFSETLPLFRELNIWKKHFFSRGNIVQYLMATSAVITVGNSNDETFLGFIPNENYVLDKCINAFPFRYLIHWDGSFSESEEKKRESFKLVLAYGNLKSVAFLIYLRILHVCFVNWFEHIKCAFIYTYYERTYNRMPNMHQIFIFSWPITFQWLRR